MFEKVAPESVGVSSESVLGFIKMVDSLIFMNTHY